VETGWLLSEDSSKIRVANDILNWEKIIGRCDNEDL
jgi:hypothetical protein